MVAFFHCIFKKDRLQILERYIDIAEVESSIPRIHIKNPPDKYGFGYVSNVYHMCIHDTRMIHVF